MREFEYFLFENFYADDQAHNSANPRNFLNKDADPILNDVSFGKAPRDQEFLQKLLESGVLRCNDAGFSFDCPVFLREDADVLERKVPARIQPLAELLSTALPEIQNCCRNIQNGFSTQVNLYHILCGMVFDGGFFDYLTEKGALATSRIHSSGLDYLAVIYEKCEELHAFSNRLLCSYNRFCNQECSLQTFGDSIGNRFDFYRFFRLLEQNRLPAAYESAKALVQNAALNKEIILHEIAAWLNGKPCSTAVMELLECFGYALNGKVSVPVFRPEHQDAIEQIEKVVEATLGNQMADLLNELACTLPITAVRHRVSRLEIANELYHLVFGSLNEELVRRGIVAAPLLTPKEGRYLRCIELYE